MPSSRANDWVIRFKYNTGLVHKMELSVSIDSPPSDPTDMTTGTFHQRDGTAINMQSGWDDLFVLISPLMNDAVPVYDVSLWQYGSDGLGATFKGLFNEYAGLSGSGGDAVVEASQQTITMRTALGNVMKLVILEGMVDSDLQQGLGDVNVATSNLWEFLSSDDNFVIGRDGALPIVFLKNSYTENESLYRKRYRST